MTEPAGDDPAPKDDSTRKLGCLGVVLVLLLIGFVINLVNGDDDEDDPPSSDLVTCPDYLEVAGPYRQGVDVEYDRAMDWDGDGVSCE